MAAKDRRPLSGLRVRCEKRDQRVELSGRDVTPDARDLGHEALLEPGSMYGAAMVYVL
jgi:hypothetical protein